MDKNLTLKLESNDKTLILGENNFKIISVEGLESSDYEINISDNLFADGGRVNKKSIKPRPIVIEFDFTDLESSEEIRQFLIGFFNPKNSGTLFVNYSGTERYIKYAVESFKNKRDSLYEPLNCIVDLICPNPHFNDIEVGDEISTWIGGWKFKFKLPFKFKQKGEPRKNIFNAGHLETPVQIVFKGPAVNPKVTNITTGKFIKVNRTLSSDDTLYINTSYGNKTVEIERDGIRKNAFNYIDLDSTFFNLEVGDNLIEYSTDNNIDPQSVQIIHKSRFLGV